MIQPFWRNSWTKAGDPILQRVARHIVCVVAGFAVCGTSVATQFQLTQLDTDGSSDWMLYVLAPDNNTVAYYRNTGTPNTQLFLTTVDGGAPQAILNDRLGWVVFSPDSQYLGISGELNGFQNEVYVWDLTAKNWTKVSHTLPSGWFCPPGGSGFEFTSDSQAVVYGIYAGSTNHVFANPISGGGTPMHQYTQSNSASHAASSFSLTPDGQHVIYHTNQSPLPNYDHLYSVPVTGGTPLRLSTHLPVGDQVWGVTDYMVTPDSQRVIYRADEGNEQYGFLYHLSSTPVTGGPVVRITENLRLVSRVDHYRLSPNGQDVLFTARNWVDNGIDLYIADTETGVSSVLYSRDGPRNYRRNNFFDFSPTGQYAVFYDRDYPSSLYGYHIEDERMITYGEGRLTATAQGTPGTMDFSFISAPQYTPDESKILFIMNTDPNNDGFYELYAVDADGGEMIKLNPQLEVTGTYQRQGISHFDLTPDGRHVLFTLETYDPLRKHELWIKDLLTDELVLAAYGLPTTGGGSDFNIYGSLTISDDGRHALFLADMDGNGDKLYSMAIPEPASSMVLLPGIAYLLMRRHSLRK